MRELKNSEQDTFKLEGAERRYGKIHALMPTTISIGEGERVALVGPSGSGKTTLLRLCNATVTASSGSVVLLGKNTENMSSKSLRKIRSRVATIPQNLGLVSSLRVWQNIATGKVGKRGFLGVFRDLFFPSQENFLEIHNILERVGIEEKLFSRTSELSGGQQQRVALARALFQNPNAILADEPVSSVDPARAASLVRLLTELAEENGLTLVMSLHNLELARAHFPRLIGLRNGKVHFDRSPNELKEREFKELYSLSQREMLEDG